MRNKTATGRSTSVAAALHSTSVTSKKCGRRKTCRSIAHEQPLGCIKSPAHGVAALADKPLPGISGETDSALACRLVAGTS